MISMACSAVNLSVMGAPVCGCGSAHYGGTLPAAPRAFCTSDSVYLDAGEGDHVCREAALREALAEAERVAAQCHAELDALAALQGRV